MSCVGGLDEHSGSGSDGDMGSEVSAGEGGYNEVDGKARQASASASDAVVNSCT